MTMYALRARARLRLRVLRMAVSLWLFGGIDTRGRFQGQLRWRRCYEAAMWHETTLLMDKLLASFDDMLGKPK